MSTLTGLGIQPDNPEARIWRYMPLGKLESLLGSSALYMTQLARFGDAHEGSMPRRTKERIDGFMARSDPRSINAAVYPSIRNRIWNYATCWTLREAECDGLWRLYGDGEGCVAIESTYARLLSGFEGGRDIAGLVRYVDYESVDDPHLTDWRLAFAKRREFEYEREVRVVRQHINLAPESKHQRPKPGQRFLTLEYWLSLYDQPEHLLVPVSLEKLVVGVHVSPYATDQYFEAVSALMARSGLNVSPVWSALRSAPLRG